MEIVNTLRKYKEPPEDEEQFDELFEQTLDDMMLREELRGPMRSRSKPEKWMLIKNQMKSNLKSNFHDAVHAGAAEGGLRFSRLSLHRSPFPKTRRAKWTP